MPLTTVLTVNNYSTIAFNPMVGSRNLDYRIELDIEQGYCNIKKTLINGELKKEISQKSFEQSVGYP